MPAAMEAGNLTSLQPRPYDVPCRREFANVPVGAGEVGRRFEADDVSGGGCEEDMRGGAEVVQVNSAAPPPPCSVDGGGVISSFPIRPSELTVSFEGQIYVFPAVTPDKLQGVLLLLGGIETPESVPSTEFQSQQCNKMYVLEDVRILLGLYVGTHGLRSSEVIHLRRRFGQWKEDGVTKQSSRIEFYEYVEAVKTGDPYVPAGQIAFPAKVGKQYQLPHKGIFPEEFGVIARYKGQGRLAEPGFQNPRWVDGELVILDGKYIKGGPVVGLAYWATEYHFLVFFQRLRLQE